MASVPAGVTVRELVRPESGLAVKLVAGRRGLERRVDQARVQRPGLGLAGYTDYLSYGRVQIIGRSENDFLAGLSAVERRRAVDGVVAAGLSCFVVTRGLTTPAELVSGAERAGIPVLWTRLHSAQFIRQLSAFLDERLADRTHLHGVLLELFGLGVLVTGESGIGKSECALDLVDRGHRLVADDVVEIRRVGDVLEGSSPELTRAHMELRGLGVINVKDLYGVSAVRPARRLELVVDLVRWDPDKEYERLGLQDERREILGVGLPLVSMPVAPGRNLALLVEVAARNQVLKERGYDAARRLAEHLDALLSGQARRRTRKASAKGRRSTS